MKLITERQKGYLCMLINNVMAAQQRQKDIFNGFDNEIDKELIREMH